MIMQLTFLGTGTSTGVPMLGCRCRTCSSTDPADHRLRASVLVRGDAQDMPSLLIDAGPDLRQQLLVHGTPALAAVLLTHIHYDHVGGIDDLRPYCYASPHGRFPAFCRSDVAAGLRHNFPYAFAKEPYPGAPSYDIHCIESGESFTIQAGSGHYTVTPLEVMHGKMPILGYRIGPLAYITDASFIPDSTFGLLDGVDTLVINALRPQPHPAHFSLGQALEAISRIHPARAYLTHASHDMLPASEIEATLPANVFLARDNSVVSI